MQALLKRTTVMVLAALLIPAVVFAANAFEEDVTPRSKKIYLEPEKSILDKGTFKHMVSLSEGYDNNSHLNPARDGDAFTQIFYRGSFKSPLSKKTDLNLDYDFMNLMYAGESNLDLIKNGFHGGLEYKINQDLIFYPGYFLDFISFINSGKDSFVDNMGELKLRHKLPFKMYHSLAYDFSFRNYTGKLTRDSAGADNSHKRCDYRNTVGYEIGKYLKKDLLKLNYEYYNNRSNEEYLKYYNYDSYKIGASITHLFNEKVYAYASAGRQFRSFRSRTLIADSRFKEWDRTYLGTAAVYYNFNKSLTFGLNYTYRQNGSNEPTQKYSGSLLTLSSYYRF